MPEPRVSVIVNCYDGMEFLKEALDSVIAQTFEDFEMIFWDNASTDGSADFADSYGDPRFRVFRSEENVVLGIARQKALEECRSELIAYLDVDDYWDVHKLEKQVSLMEEDESCLLSYSDGWKVLGEKTWLISSETTTFKEGEGVFQHLIKDNFISWQSIMFRRTVLDKVSFNSDLHYCPDWDMLLKISLRGKVRVLNEPLVYYRLHDNNLTKQLTQTAMDDQKRVIEYFSDEIQSFGLQKSSLLNAVRVGGVMSFLRNGDPKAARLQAMEISSEAKWSFVMLKWLVLMRCHFILNPTLIQWALRCFRLQRLRYY